MSIQLTNQEQYEMAKLQQGYETCSEILDEYFEPWISHLYLLIKRKLSVLDSHANSTHLFVLWLVSMAIVSSVILFITADAFHQYRYDAHTYAPAKSSLLIPVEVDNVPESFRMHADSILVNVNTASSEELSSLPGIGAVLAERIIKEREEHGLFHYPEDLLSVSGIGEKTLLKIIPGICFGDGLTETP